MTTVTLTIAIPDDIPVKNMVQEIDDALLKEFKHDFTIRTNIEKTGRWKRHQNEREYDICTHCGVGVKRREYGLNDDGSEWVEEWSYRYCPWCGARIESEE